MLGLILEISLKIKKKMYNGIGLSTPRGSGTSGYISSNKAMVSK